MDLEKTCGMTSGGGGFAPEQYIGFVKILEGGNISGLGFWEGQTEGLRQVKKKAKQWQWRGKVIPSIPK